MPVRPGPSSVPNAAISLTSPAPVAPMTCAGSIRARPTARPASALTTPTPVGRNAASASPSTAMPNVIGLGTRRTRKSIAAVALPQPAMAQTATASKVLNNGLPQNRVDLIPQRRDAGHHEDGDQRGQKPVFEQVLPVMFSRESRDCR